ncbi:MAG: SOS response-associated peptidase [Phycisphaerales bacterium]
MCGRFTYRFTWQELARLLSLIDWPAEHLRPRYNVAPTQPAPVVRMQQAGRRTASMLTWGLVPSWASDVAIASRMINARAESLSQKPAFRAAFARRRCLVPISGFYEWKKLGDGKRKQPFIIERDDHQPFMLAGLWERWTKGDEPLETFTIITTDANELLRPLHDRMPVILSDADLDLWLNPQHTDADALRRLLQPADPAGFRARPVSTRVNSPKYDDPSILDEDSGTLFNP